MNSEQDAVAVNVNVNVNLDPGKSNFFPGSHGPWPPWDGHWHIISSSGAKSLPIFLMSAILNGGPKVYAVLAHILAGLLIQLLIPSVRGLEPVY